jgi:hypothetical protein
VRATSFDTAILRAEEEAARYAAVFEDTKYTGYVMAYELPDDAITDLTDVFSQMRDSDLEPEEYLDHFHDTGTERASRSENAPE